MSSNPRDGWTRRRRVPSSNSGASDSGLRAFLVSHPADSRLRVIDSLFGLAACLICLPIFALTFTAGIVVSSILSAIGVPTLIVPFLAYMVFGLGGAIALSFVVLVLIYRRLPAWIRATAVGEDRASHRPERARRRVATPDPSTLDARVAAADRDLALQASADASLQSTDEGPRDAGPRLPN